MDRRESFIVDVLQSADEACLAGDKDKVSAMVQLAYDYFEVLPGEGDRSEWLQRPRTKPNIAPRSLAGSLETSPGRLVTACVLPARYAVP